MPSELQRFALQKAQERGLDPDFVSRLITQESAWNPAAVGPPTRFGRAQGLMQILPSTGTDLGVTDATQLLDPTVNIDAGTKYLAQLSKRYGGNLPKVAAAYNWGLGNVPVEGPLNIAGLPRETRNYVQKVVGPVTGGASTTAPASFGPPARPPRTESIQTAPDPQLFESIYNYVFGQENAGLPPAKTWPGPELGLPPEQTTTGDLGMLGMLALSGMGGLAPAIARGLPAVIIRDPLTLAMRQMLGATGSLIGGEMGQELAGDVGRNIGIGLGNFLPVPVRRLPAPRPAPLPDPLTVALQGLRR